MGKLRTKWGEQLNGKDILPEYPRPAMRRDYFYNLNGYWDYAITKKCQTPCKFFGKILVPFSPESELSGVGRQLKPDEYLWYTRILPKIRKEDKGKRILLHFGAVDQACKIWLNGKYVARHEGGYLPFTVDITRFYSEKKTVLTMVVRDLSDTSYHTRGKQKLNAKGMFYTAQSGIWQTVWMECVPQNYIEKIQCVPCFDEKRVDITVFSKQRESVVIEVGGEREKRCFRLDKRNNFFKV